MEIIILTSEPTHTVAVWSDPFESTSAIKGATMKYMDDFCYKRKPSHALLPKLKLFTVSKDECNIKEETGMTMKNKLHILW